MTRRLSTRPSQVSADRQPTVSKAHLSELRYATHALTEAKALRDSTVADEPNLPTPLAWTRRGDVPPAVEIRRRLS